MKKLSKQILEPIYSFLEKEFNSNPMPVVDLIAVHEDNPYKVLIATILSARTKDQTTAQAAYRLFEIAPNMEELGKLSIESLQELIYPVGFYKNKAKFLYDMPSALKKLFDGEIPKSVEDLVKLPGVGRKTANLVVAVAFKLPAICVDTHVHRITNRLGFVSTKTPFETEMKLRDILPESYWIRTNAYFVSFGQNRCKPRSPECSLCQITNFCNWYKARIS